MKKLDIVLFCRRLCCKQSYIHARCCSRGLILQKRITIQNIYLNIHLKNNTCRIRSVRDTIGDSGKGDIRHTRSNNVCQKARIKQLHLES